MGKSPPDIVRGLECHKAGCIGDFPLQGSPGPNAVTTGLNFLISDYASPLAKWPGWRYLSAELEEGQGRLVTLVLLAPPTPERSPDGKQKVMP
jgi:hypothetical protein